jgi:hypothetical protein
VLYINIVKVDWDVTHVVMAIPVYFKCMFYMFHLFQMNVASLLSGYYIYMHIASICFKYFQVFHTYVCECFILMLHIFIMISNVFEAFPQVFQTFVSNDLFVFFCM